MKARRRQGALGLAAVATLALVAWVSGEEEPAQALALPAKARPADARPARAAAELPRLDLERLQARNGAFGEPGADPFAPRSWTPAAAAEKPPAPVPPPLPYTYFGRMTEDGKTFVFLQRGERSYTVGSGDVLDQAYRVEEITPAAVVLTYLPLKHKQILQMGVGTE